MPEKINVNNTLIPFILLLLIALGFSSCQNSGDKDLYIGSWQYKEVINAGDITYNTIRTLVLTKTTYEETYVIERENSGSITGIIGTRGNLSLTHTSMMFELKAIGTCARDSLDACTSVVLWYSEGSQYWTDNVQYFGLVIRGDFHADETTLTLRRDLNNDGDTEDAGEDIVFERI